MSLYSYASTLTWLSANGSVGYAEPASEGSPATKVAATAAASNASPLSRAASAWGHDCEINWHTNAPAKTCASFAATVEEKSSPSPCLSTLTATQMNIPSDCFLSPDTSAFPAATGDAAHHVKKCHSGDTATYYGNSGGNGSAISTYHLRMENVDKQSSSDDDVGDDEGTQQPHMVSCVPRSAGSAPRLGRSDASVGDSHTTTTTTATISSFTAPLTEPAPKAIQWRLEVHSASPPSSPLSSLAADDRGYYYGLQPPMNPTDTPTTSPFDREDSAHDEVWVTPAVVRHATQRDAAPQRRRRPEEMLVALPRPPAPRPAAGRPVTRPTPPPQPLGVHGASQQQPQAHSSAARPTLDMMPLPFIRKKRIVAQADMPISSPPVSNTCRMDVSHRPARQVRPHTEDSVPVVTASDALLRRLRPAAVRSVTAMPTSVLAVRAAILKSSPHVQLSLSRRPSHASSFSSMQRTDTALSNSSTRTVHPVVQHAVYEATLCEAPPLHCRPPVATYIESRHGDEASASHSASLSGARTVVISNPYAASTNSRALPSSAMLSTPAAPARSASARTSAMRRTTTTSPATTSVDSAATTAAVVTASTQGPRRIVELSSAGTVSTSKPSKEMEDDDDGFMTASFVALLFNTPASPQPRVDAAVKETAAAPPANTCVYVHPRPPPPPPPPPHAPQLRRSTETVAAVAAASAETPRRSGSARSAHPFLRRHASRMTPVSPPTTTRDGLPLLPRRGSSSKAAPVVPNTAPVPGIYFRATSSSSASTRAWLPPAQAPAQMRTAADDAVLPAPAARPVVAISRPVTASISPSTTPPRHSHQAMSVMSAESSIPLVRSRTAQESQRQTSTALNCAESRCSPHSQRYRPSHTATAAMARQENVPNLPLNALQLALLPSDDGSLLQTPRNGSSYEPSQASPEWKDVPVPVLRRSLIARAFPEGGRGDQADSSALTLRPHHHR